MPNQRELMERFKRDFPEEFARQQEIAQEIFKDLPKMPELDIRQRFLPVEVIRDGGN